MQFKPFHYPIFYVRKLRPRKVKWASPLRTCVVPMLMEGPGMRYLGESRVIQGNKGE